ncbi:MAG: transporter substrate-binding domain-containing protein [Alphaproteobacteria bacterium]|nr:transporter substrate-binding domain-containing protein [Alphaproteobacteria bacterium]
MKNFLLVIVAAALALVVQNFVLHKEAHDTAKTETAYERVMRTGTLRCGYTPYSIGFMKDPNTGKMSGIYYDIITRLAENLSLKIDWVEEVGWGEQIEGLNAKRYDLICSPTALNAGRARSADFSIPLYYSPVHVWAKKGRTDLTGDIKKLDNPQIKIATLDGEQTSVFAKQFFPNAQQVSLPQTSPFSDLLMQVTTGKADLVFAEPLVVHEFMQNNPDSLQQITPDDHPLMVVPNVLLLPRGEYEFKEMIDNGLREMFNSRLIDQFIDTYETVPNSYVRETTRR